MVVLKQYRQFIWPNPLQFFSQEIYEELVLCPPLPANVNELKQRITTPLESVTQDMRQRVWKELDYRLDGCRVIGSAYITHL